MKLEPAKEVVTAHDVLAAGACYSGVVRWVQSNKLQISAVVAEHAGNHWISLAAVGGEFFYSNYSYVAGDARGVGDSDSDGNGYGDGDGYGNGNGSGDGNGYGDGDGNGYGIGDGNGNSSCGFR